MLLATRSLQTQALFQGKGSCQAAVNGHDTDEALVPIGTSWLHRYGDDSGAYVGVGDLADEPVNP